MTVGAVRIGGEMHENRLLRCSGQAIFFTVAGASRDGQEARPGKGGAAILSLHFVLVFYLIAPYWELFWSLKIPEL